MNRIFNQNKINKTLKGLNMNTIFNQNKINKTPERVEHEYNFQSK
jgi:ribosomal protein L30/L7E